MTTLELLFTVSAIFWVLIFLYLTWIHSKIMKISKKLNKLKVWINLKPKLLKILIILAIIFVAGYLIFQASTTVVNPYILISDLKNDPETYFGKEIQVIGNVTGPLTGDSQSLKFTLKDEQDDIIVTYKGPIPQNFMEGINVVVIGELDTDGQLIANQILTKCPSKYAIWNKSVDIPEKFMMKSKRFNAIVNIAILLFFLIATISGIIIWLVLPGSYGLGFQSSNSSQDLGEISSTRFLELSRHNWIDIHIISSLIFVVVVVLHDVLHWKWFKSLPKILKS